MTAITIFIIGAGSIVLALIVTFAVLGIKLLRQALRERRERDAEFEEHWQKIRKHIDRNGRRTSGEIADVTDLGAEVADELVKGGEV